MKERLQKLMAQASIASRRASEDLIAAGRVRVNGAVATLGDKADPATDVIEVDGARLRFDAQADHIYIMLNKPKQVLSTDKPHKGDRRETVSDLLGRDEHLFSIGRLDADSEGMVVMTNDGDLAQKLSHPRYRHTKTYRVEVLGLPSVETLDKWQRGVTLEDGQTAPCFVEIVSGNVRGSVLRIVMTEGKKRQIRRVASLLGHPVRRLTRTHMGMLALGNLEPGQSRELTPKEVMALRTPSPEIKSLRATPRRRDTDTAAAESSEERPRRRIPRVSAAVDDQPPRRRVARVQPDEGGEERPRRRRTTSQDDAPKRRSTRTGSAPSDDADAPKRPARPRKAYAPDDDNVKRPRRPRKPAATGDTTDETKRPSRAPKPTADSSKKRPPKPFAPFKNRDRKRRTGKGNSR
jgi:pseudouridine synthase